MTLVAVADTSPERSLDELAAIANREHASVLAAGSALLEHTIRAGEALIAAREVCGLGLWTAWLTENFDSTPHTAAVYMRVAHHRDAVRSAGVATLMEAVAYVRAAGLAGPFKAGGDYGNGHGDEARVAAMRLCDEGHTPREIARVLGVSRTSVRKWVDPAYARRHEESIKRSRTRRLELERLSREKERDRAIKLAVRKRGGALAEAYAMAERIQDVLGQAHRETEDREAREALSLAGEHYRKMRDEIVRALGVSA